MIRRGMTTGFGEVDRFQRYQGTEPTTVSGLGTNAAALGQLLELCIQ